VAGTQDHARHGGLALAGGLIAGIRREVQRRAGRGRLARLSLRCLRGSTLLAGSPVAIRVFVELSLGALLGENEVGLEMGAGNDLVLLLLLLVAPAALPAGMLGRRFPALARGRSLRLRLGLGLGLALGRRL